MKRFLFLIVLIAAVGSVHGETLFPGIVGDALIDSLQAHYTPNPSIDVLDYTGCRDTMYAVIDNHDNSVVDVYSGLVFAYDPSLPVDPSTYVYDNGNGINAEHTWPQSLFDGTEPLYSDLNNLFPCWVNVNGARGNMPFGYVSTPTSWYYNGQTYSSAPSAEDLPMYSRKDGVRFEVRDVQKGNTARAIFYMWAIWQNSSAMQQNDGGAENLAFFNSMKDDLLQWHRNDPPDSLEIARSHSIAFYQGSDNPFVIDTSLVARAFFTTDDVPEVPANRSQPKSFTIASVYPNPFNPGTTVVVHLNDDATINAAVFNLLGQQVATLAEGRFSQGSHTFLFDGSKLTSGIYLLRVTTPDGNQAVRRISLVR